MSTRLHSDIPMHPQVFEVCRAEKWECTEKVLEVALEPFRQVAGTEVVEDGFRVLRAEETLRSGYRKEVSRKRAWHSLIESGTETQVHRYDGVPWRGECAPRGYGLRCEDSSCGLVGVGGFQFMCTPASRCHFHDLACGP